MLEPQPRLFSTKASRAFGATCSTASSIRPNRAFRFSSSAVSWARAGFDWPASAQPASRQTENVNVKSVRIAPPQHALVAAGNFSTTGSVRHGGHEIQLVDAARGETPRVA